MICIASMGPTDPAMLPYAIVRLAEAFIYNDALAGIRGDVDDPAAGRSRPTGPRLKGSDPLI